MRGCRVGARFESRSIRKRQSNNTDELLAQIFAIREKEVDGEEGRENERQTETFGRQKFSQTDRYGSIWKDVYREAWRHPRNIVRGRNLKEKEAVEAHYTNE